MKSLRAALPVINSFTSAEPGGLAEEVLNFANIDGENLGPEDALVVICGANDVARNEAERALNIIDKTLQTYCIPKIVVVDFPIRYDLKMWSCVNKEIKRSNAALEALSKKYPNVLLVKSSMASRNLHTQHGMHMNGLGKHWLARRICEVLVESTRPVLIHRSTSGRTSTPTSPLKDEYRSNEQQLPVNESSSILVTLDTESTSSCELSVVAEPVKKLASGNFSPLCHTTPP
ncbi:hypothetical protein J6590_046694 [Homalodisca vitripennis]|nr:hypothetical protein J6590_046694 [Homalodisca vitripennis]